MIDKAERYKFSSQLPLNRFFHSASSHPKIDAEGVQLLVQIAIGLYFIGFGAQIEAVFSGGIGHAQGQYSIALIFFAYRF